MISNRIAIAVQPVQVNREYQTVSHTSLSAKKNTTYRPDQLALSSGSHHMAMMPSTYAIHQSFNMNSVFNSTASPMGLSAAGKVRLVTASRSLSLKRMLDKHSINPVAMRFKVVGQRMASGAAFGAVGSVINSTINIATGKWSSDVAVENTVKDVIKGTVGGAGFGLGMSLSVLALTHMGVAGLPLTITGIVVGSAVSIASYMGMDKALDQWQWK